VGVTDGDGVGVAVGVAVGVGVGDGIGVPELLLLLQPTVTARTAALSEASTACLRMERLLTVVSVKGMTSVN
jgi:hypothetical protein